MAKPPKLGTIWVAKAKIAFIDDSVDPPVWVTVANVMDTPAAIAKVLAGASVAYPKKTLWVHSKINGKYIPK